MSKIICDVCGTSYPETATQCPICGCVRSGDSQSVAADSKDTASGTYTYVRGGRFSKANVRKRNRATQQTEDYTSDISQEANEETEEKKSNTGLVVTAVVLLLAIVAVVIYIALKFFMPALPENTEPSGTQDTAGSTGASELTIPCQEVTLDVTEIVMDDAVGSARMLYATVLPADTTDVITYESSDESVVTVTDTGKITVVGPGEATITVTCGSASAVCTVVCDVEESTEDTTEETTEETTEDTTASDEEFRLNRTDITFSRKGDSWMIYSGKIAKTQITWTTDDEKVATIDNGTVVAVGSGTTKVHAEYNGEKASCIIRCAFEDASENQGVGGTGGVTEDGGGSSVNDGTYRLDNISSEYDTDVSLSKGGSFTLQLVDSNGNAVNAEWSVADSSVCSVSNGVVTAIKAGETNVVATYNGQEYKCYVRVK